MIARCTCPDGFTCEACAQPLPYQVERWNRTAAEVAATLRAVLAEVPRPTLRLELEEVNEELSLF